MVKNLLQCRRSGFNPRVEKIPWRREWQPIPESLLGKSHGEEPCWSHVTVHGVTRVGHDLVTKPSPPPPTRSLIQPGIRMSLRQILPQSLQRECNPVSVLISAFCYPKQRTQSHHPFGLLSYRFWATKWVWFKWASLVTQLVKNPPAMQDTPVQFLGWKTPWRRDSLPPPVFLLAESHEQRSPAGYHL